MSMLAYFGDFMQGYTEDEVRRQKTRKDNLEAFDRFMQMNPDATVDQFDAFAQSLAGNDYWLRKGLPAKDMVQTFVKKQALDRKRAEEDRMYQIADREMKLKNQFMTYADRAIARVRDPKDFEAKFRSYLPDVPGIEGTANTFLSGFDAERAITDFRATKMAELMPLIKSAQSLDSLSPVMKSFPGLADNIAAEWQKFEDARVRAKELEEKKLAQDSEYHTARIASLEAQTQAAIDKNSRDNEMHDPAMVAAWLKLQEATQRMGIARTQEERAAALHDYEIARRDITNQLDEITLQVNRATMDNKIAAPGLANEQTAANIEATLASTEATRQRMAIAAADQVTGAIEKIRQNSPTLLQQYTLNPSLHETAVKNALAAMGVEMTEEARATLMAAGAELLEASDDQNHQKVIDLANKAAAQQMGRVDMMSEAFSNSVATLAEAELENRPEQTNALHTAKSLIEAGNLMPVAGTGDQVAMRMLELAKEGKTSGEIYNTVLQEGLVTQKPTLASLTSKAIQDLGSSSDRRNGEEFTADAIREAGEYTSEAQAAIFRSFRMPPKKAKLVLENAAADVRKKREEIAVEKNNTARYGITLHADKLSNLENQLLQAENELARAIAQIVIPEKPVNEHPERPAPEAAPAKTGNVLQDGQEAYDHFRSSRDPNAPNLFDWVGRQVDRASEGAPPRDWQNNIPSNAYDR